MPAIPFIAAAASVAGGVGQINQGNAAAASAAQQGELMRQQVALEAEKFGWTKAQQEAELQRRMESSNNFWNSMEDAPTYKKSLKMAEGELSPQYDEQMKGTLENVGNDLKSRGFYGQLPGDVLTQNAAAKVEEAKNRAVGGLANQFYEAGQQRKLAKESLGIGAFGTYGETPTTPGASTTTPGATTPTTGTNVNQVPGTTPIAGTDKITPDAQDLALLRSGRISEITAKYGENPFGRSPGTNGEKNDMSGITKAFLDPANLSGGKSNDLGKALIDPANLFKAFG